MTSTASASGSGSTTTASAPSYTSLELHTPTTLLASPHLPALVSLINYSFDTAHNKDPLALSLLPPGRARLDTYEQLGKEVGPDGFIIVMLQQQPTLQENELDRASSQTPESQVLFRSPNGQRVIGTASARPHTITKEGKGIVNPTISLFKRSSLAPDSAQTNDDDGIPQWEILASAVDPTLQGRGLGTQLMNLTIDEIKRRCGSGLRDPSVAASEASQSRNQEASGTILDRGETTPDGINGLGAKKENKEVILLLSTMQQLNEQYYTMRGWTATQTKHFPPGTRGSQDGFSIVEMCKRVELWGCFVCLPED